METQNINLDNNDDLPDLPENSRPSWKFIPKSRPATECLPKQGLETYEECMNKMEQYLKKYNPTIKFKHHIKMCKAYIFIMKLWQMHVLKILVQKRYNLCTPRHFSLNPFGPGSKRNGNHITRYEYSGMIL